MKVPNAFCSLLDRLRHRSPVSVWRETAKLSLPNAMPERLNGKTC